MGKPVFELEDVYFSYLKRFPALCGVNIRIEAGSRVAIIGANGTGKSSILAMLDALIFPDQGVLKAFGYPLNETIAHEERFRKNFRRKVGFVFQNPEVQLFCPTVEEDIVFGPLQLGVSYEETQKRLKSLSTLLHIDGLLERQPHQLSIGEKKKIAIASVLAIDPEVLLLDEPTAGLDPQTSRDIIDTLLKEHDKGKTVVTATHDLHIIEEIADIVHVIGSQKKIIRSGPPQELLSDHRFLQDNNLVHIHRHRHKGEVHTHPHTHLHEHHTG